MPAALNAPTDHSSDEDYLILPTSDLPRSPPIGSNCYHALAPGDGGDGDAH